MSLQLCGCKLTGFTYHFFQNHVKAFKFFSYFCCHHEDCYAGHNLDRPQELNAVSETTHFNFLLNCIVNVYQWK